MTLSTQTMTDEQRKALILEYFNTFDRGGIRSTGEPILSLFADDCMVWFPKWGLARASTRSGRCSPIWGAPSNGSTTPPHT